jgi:alkylated DNA repair dioxygenase AlkB
MLNPECFDYHPGFLDRTCADRSLKLLWRELKWQQAEITLFGRRLMQPRLIAWYGDSSARYSYSALSLDPEPWHPLLAELKSRLEAFTKMPFNSVLANAYRNGDDSMGWHRDDEPELGHRPVIASLSLGAPRKFLVRTIEKPAAGRRKSERLTLEHGSLLLMSADSQASYQHALPKTRQKTGLRINLTYRMVRLQAPD